MNVTCLKCGHTAELNYGNTRQPVTRLDLADIMLCGNCGTPHILKGGVREASYMDLQNLSFGLLEIISERKAQIMQRNWDNARKSSD